jgi:predicted alpha/beta hydrolase family esterase
MRAAQTDVLMVPGLGGAGPEHWQTRWARKLSTARRVEPPGGAWADGAEWRASLITQAKTARRPVVLVAHDLGVIVAVQTAPHLAEVVRGAFLVAVPDLDVPYVPEEARALGPVPRDPLPFPSFLVASRTDPYCSFEFAEELGRNWRSLLIDAGDAGHLDAASRHGPWPEGLLVFSRLLRNLKAG